MVAETGAGDTDPCAESAAASASTAAGLPSLGDLAAVAWRRRWLILAAGLLGLGLAGLWIRLTPPEYRAAMVVGPVATLADDAVGASLPGQLPPAPGRRPPDQEVAPNFTRYLELLGSVEVARRLAAREGIMVALFPEAWDGDTGTWRAPPGPVAWVERAAMALLGRPGWAPPAPEDLAERLLRRLSIESVGATAMRRLSLRHTDRATAITLVAAIHAEADGLLRQAAAARAEAHIAYLQAELGRVALAEHRQGLSVLLAQQERDRMLIRIGLPYAADPIEPPSAPLRPSWPNPVLLVPAAVGAGLFGGLLLAFARQGRTRPAGDAGRHPRAVAMPAAPV